MSDPLVLLAPDPLPVLRQVTAQDMLRTFHRVLPDVRCPRSGSGRYVSVQFGVADDQQPLHLVAVLRLAMRKELLENVAVVLDLSTFCRDAPRLRGA